MRQFMYGIPNDLLEAARIDGASDFRIYYSVILPLVRSSIAVLGILIFLWTWDEFLWPLVTITNNEMKTLPLLLAHFTQAEQKFPGDSLAGATLVIGPVLVVYAFFQRHFVRGLEHDRAERHRRPSMATGGPQRISSRPDQPDLLGDRRPHLPGRRLPEAGPADRSRGASTRRATGPSAVSRATRCRPCAWASSAEVSTSGPPTGSRTAICCSCTWR